MPEKIKAKWMLPSKLKVGDTIVSAGGKLSKITALDPPRDKGMDWLVLTEDRPQGVLCSPSTRISIKSENP